MASSADFCSELAMGSTVNSRLAHAASMSS